MSTEYFRGPNSRKNSKHSEYVVKIQRSRPSYVRKYFFTTQVIIMHAGTVVFCLYTVIIAPGTCLQKVVPETEFFVCFGASKSGGKSVDYDKYKPLVGTTRRL